MLQLLLFYVFPSPNNCHLHCLTHTHTTTLSQNQHTHVTFLTRGPLGPYHVSRVWKSDCFRWQTTIFVVPPRWPLKRAGHAALIRACVRESLVCFKIKLKKNKNKQPACNNEFLDCHLSHVCFYFCIFCKAKYIYLYLKLSTKHPQHTNTQSHTQIMTKVNKNCYYTIS